MIKVIMIVGMSRWKEVCGGGVVTWAMVMAIS